MTELRLDGRRVVVTGGAAGIGRVIAEVFTAAGARVHVCDVDTAALDETLRLPRGGEPRRCAMSPISIRSRASSPSVAESLGGLDVLVNNAGIAGPTAQGRGDRRSRTGGARIDVDLSGPFYCAASRRPAAEGRRGRRVINMSSVAGRLGFPLRTPYAAAKWGSIGFTKSLAMELGPDRIRVNAIQPGVVEGPGSSPVIEAQARALGITPDEQRERSLATVSMRSMVTAREVADTALFLASDAGSTSPVRRSRCAPVWRRWHETVGPPEPERPSRRGRRARGMIGCVDATWPGAAGPRIASPETRGAP